MLSLNNSKKFQNEFSEFEQQISKITFDKTKRQAQKMLQELKSHIVLINNGHASEHDGNIDPHTLRENVVEIQRLRYSLQVFLKST
jgi:S-adenosylhomocysteine hydrolase